MRFLRTLVQSEDALGELLECLAKDEMACGLDTESDGPLLLDGWKVLKTKGRVVKYKKFINMYLSTTTGFSFAFENKRSFYVPLCHKTGNLPASLFPRLVNAMMLREGRIWVHNLKHELLAFRRNVVSAPISHQITYEAKEERTRSNWMCTQVGMWFAGKPGPKGGYGLKELAPEYCGVEMATFEKTLGDAGGFSVLDPEQGAAYACEDAEVALRLGKEQVLPTIREQKTLDWFLDVEMPTVAMLREVEDNGMPLDSETHIRTLEKFGAEQRELEERWAWETDLNMNSPKQLGTLYEDGVWDGTGVPETNLGKSAAAEYIRWQLDRCPPRSPGHRLASIYLEHSRLKKLTGTYGHNLLQIAQQYPDGRLHGGLLQTGTRTGRFSSSYPNLQNFPKRTEQGKEIRKSIRPPDGSVLLSADYSQIELRVLAHFAGKGHLYEAYKRGADIHRQTADMIGELISLELSRDQGKVGNFLPIYGGGPKRAASALGLTLSQAKQFLDAHSEVHSDAHDVLNRAKKVGETRGYVRTFGGRRRYVRIAYWRGVLSDLRSSGHSYRTSPEFREAWYQLGREQRAAANTPIQGGAADIVKVGMLRAWRTVRGRMFCQIHDDILFEVDKRDQDEAAEALQLALEGAGAHFDLKVPLVAEPVLGADWSQL